VAKTIQDPLLGPLAWNEPLERWEFVLKTESGPVDAMILADPCWDPLGPEPLERTRASAFWIGANEPHLRARVAAAMFEEWWTDYGDPVVDESVELANFAGVLRLGEVTYAADGLAYLWYVNDHQAGGELIRLQIDPAGEIVTPPATPW
jgi:hypothetical protein